MLEGMQHQKQKQKSRSGRRQQQETPLAPVPLLAYFWQSFRSSSVLRSSRPTPTTHSTWQKTGRNVSEESVKSPALCKFLQLGRSLECSLCLSECNTHRQQHWSLSSAHIRHVCSHCHAHVLCSYSICHHHHHYLRHALLLHHLIFWSTDGTPPLATREIEIKIDFLCEQT